MRHTDESRYGPVPWEMVGTKINSLHAEGKQGKGKKKRTRGALGVLGVGGLFVYFLLSQNLREPKIPTT